MMSSFNVRRAVGLRQATWRRAALLLFVAIGTSSASASPQDVPFADAVLRELINFLEQRDQTLGQWLRLHPEASWQTFEHGLDRGFAGAWCARVTHPLDTEGTVRRLYFYPPPREGATTLPDSRIEECRLGSIRIERNEPDSSAGAGIAEAAISAVERHFGPGTRERFAGGHVSWHTGVWTEFEPLQNGARWRVGDATVVVGYNDRPLRHGPGFVAMAFLPLSAISLERPVIGELAEAEWEPMLDRRIIAAADSAGLEAASTVAAAFESHPEEASEPTVPDSTLLAATETLLAAGDGADRPDRRAAAWLAADLGVRLLVARVGEPGCAAPQPTIVRRLIAQGLEIVPFPYGCAPEYWNELLVRAIRADSTGIAGELAFISLLERGWTRKGAGTGPEMSSVIAQGEAFLARKPEAKLRPLVHFLVGDAYRDIVALASGLPSSYVNPPKYAPEAEDARIAAIDHYRQGIEGDADPTLADWAWREAWRLQAGLPPTRARFFYIWD